MLGVNQPIAVRMIGHLREWLHQLPGTDRIPTEVVNVTVDTKSVCLSLNAYLRLGEGRTVKHVMGLKGWIYCAAALLSGYGQVSQAGIVTKTFKFSAGSFTPVVDPNSIVPYDTVKGKFTISYDRLVSRPEGPTGVVLHNINIPLQPGVAFRYDYIDIYDIGMFQVGGTGCGSIAVSGGDCDTFGLSFQITGFGHPQFGGLVYSNGSVIPNESFYAHSGSVSPIPEPAAWTLMISGFGLVGFTLRRQHRQVPLSA